MSEEVNIKPKMLDFKAKSFLNMFVIYWTLENGVHFLVCSG